MTAGRQVIQVPLADLDDGANVRTEAARRSPHRIRQDNELRDSIRELGMLQPITVVRRRSRFEVLYGHRRTAAARAAGLETVPAIVVDEPDDTAIRQLAENELRLAVNPLDVARTLRHFLDSHPEITQTDLAKRLGRSGFWMSTKLLLLDMDDETQTAVAEGRLAQHRAYAHHKASTVPARRSRPRILERDSEEARTASVTVPLTSDAQTPRGPVAKAEGTATISVEHDTGSIELVVNDLRGYGIFVSINRETARLLGLRLTQAYQASTPKAAA